MTTVCLVCETAPSGAVELFQPTIAEARLGTN